ncbi:VTT domain-containing protein [Thalassotalea psychrophila]|uniref:TVP38/TMEM64 family membrane protein n=1 Tax=Thalassotalea psychrophila TaxID=3065647 RepID=A0ABY9TUV3_9GAMM|nr:VTT domain-containing protein [Colwelliaceae bacterium SQ149]
MMKSFWLKYKAAITFLGFFLAISAGIALIFNYSGLLSHFDQAWVDNKIKQQGSDGILYFIAVIALSTSISLPRQVAAFAAGYAFGVWQGTLVATFAAALGCSITFYTARFIARPLVIKHFSDKVDIFNKFLQQDTFQKTFIIRLIPAGNNFLLNLCSGVGAIDARKFIFASYLGFFPQMAIFALAGSGIQMMSYWQIGASAVLSVVACLLSYRLYRKYKAELQS